jgi:hypothetical protein
LVMFTLISFCSHAWAEVLYVAADARSGGDGRSWQTAFRTIGSAIRIASVTNTKWPEIWVKRGTYRLGSQLRVTEPVKILGGFNGNETNSSQRNYWGWSPTIIDGGLATRCLHITSPCVIDGFRIRNGYSPYSVGGGIYINGSLPGNVTAYIQNCLIQNNNARTGGGVYLYRSNSYFKNCYFYENESEGGGAMYHRYSSPTIEKCIFRGNISFGGGAIMGYHRHPNDQTPKITNCLFYGNQSYGYGGAISHNQVWPTITNCTFTQNTANYPGGAYYGANSEGPRIRNSIMWGNWPDELDVSSGSSRLYVSFSNIEGGWTGSGSGNIDVDPSFRGTSDFHLSEGSACIDAGSGGYPYDDIVGTPRPLDGDEDGVAMSDMGAYEYIPVP